MDKYLNENCRSAKNLMNKYLKKQIENFELERHFDICLDCQNTSNESRKLKKMLQRAVANDFAPQNLIDSIRQAIRS